MNYNTIKYYSTVNGDGVRTALFVSGCRIHCDGCFNKAAWDFNCGKELTEEKINDILDSIDKPYIAGLSILGGEPMDDNNCGDVLYIIKKFRERFGNTKDIWMWSGYYIEDSMKNETKKEAINLCDYIIDGPFINSLHSKDIILKGSSNQRIWHKKEDGNFEIISR